MIGDHVKGGLHGAQPSLTDLDDDGNLVPTVDFRPVYAPILKTWLGVDDQAVLGKTYSPLSLFKSGPGLPAAVEPPASPTPGYWLAGPTGHVHGFGTRDQVRLARARRAPDRRRRAHADAQGPVARAAPTAASSASATPSSTARPARST